MGSPLLHRRRQLPKREPFDRLRPLLLLQLLPEDHWSAAPDDGSLMPSCRQALMSCVDDESEMQQVRKLAVSLLARLPPKDGVVGGGGENTEDLMWARVRRLADKPYDAAEEPTSALALYYVCCGVTLHYEMASTAADDNHAPILLRILDVQSEWRLAQRTRSNG